MTGMPVESLIESGPMNHPQQQESVGDSKHESSQRAGNPFARHESTGKRITPEEVNDRTPTPQTLKCGPS